MQRNSHESCFNEKSTLSRDKFCAKGTADGLEIHRLGVIDVQATVGRAGAITIPQKRNQKLKT